MELSDFLTTLLLFSLVVMGPIFAYSGLITGMSEKYGVTMSASDDTEVFDIASSIIDKAETFQASVQGMATGNVFTDMVNMMTAGLGTLGIFWDMTAMVTNIADAFLGIVNLSGVNGGWIGAGVLGVMLVFITAKILSLIFNRDV